MNHIHPHWSAMKMTGSITTQLSRAPDSSESTWIFFMALNDLEVIETIFFYDCRNIRMHENDGSAENNEKTQQKK